MLSNGVNHDPSNKWQQEYEKRSSNIPPVIIHHAENILKPGKGKPKHAATTINIYQIVLDTIQNIPVPNIVLQNASKLNSKIRCRLSISLFDLESISFFGKTWKSSAIPVLSNVGSTQQAESDSEISLDESGADKSRIDKQRASLIGNKLNLQLKNQVEGINLVCLLSHSYPKKACGGSYRSLI